MDMYFKLEYKHLYLTKMLDTLNSYLSLKL